MRRIVELSEEHLALARQEARRRQAHNESARLRGRNRAPAAGEKALRMHVLGCIGEVAVAKFLGFEQHLFVNKTAIRGAADLPGNIEVKTRSNHDYDLLIQLDDDPSKTFILATYEEGPGVVIHGWIAGQHAMRKELIRVFVRNRPCYAVPQYALRPMESLPKPLGNLEVAIRPVHCWLAVKTTQTGSRETVLMTDDSEAVKELGWLDGSQLTCTTTSESFQYIIGGNNERV